MMFALLKKRFFPRLGLRVPRKVFAVWSMAFLSVFAEELFAAAIVTPPASGSQVKEARSFRRDVMPVFFRAGCNQGGCHGAARGKDGFMLSLFGYDAPGDYFRLTQEFVGRRINVAAPEQSLLLLKAIGGVPHTGGEVIAKDSPLYQTLLDWISAGAPDDPASVPEPVSIALVPDNMVFDTSRAPIPTKVIAKYTDGSSRDVTALALFSSNNPAAAKVDAGGVVTPSGRGDTSVFARFNRFTVGAEILVLPENKGFVWPNPVSKNAVDRAVYKRLEQLRILPSPLCDDATFVRRVFLDLSGSLPSRFESESFIDDPALDKRTKLIEHLLQSQGFIDMWTNLWAEWVRVKGGGYAPAATDVKAADAYYEWIREQIALNRPWDEFVADQITASGSNLTDGPANLFTMLVHDVKVTPKSLASDFSQLFTGVRIQCAECHNHPFDRWTMNDYYGWVSFFTGIRRKQGVEPREFYVFNDVSAAPAKHLIDERPMPARVLGGESAVPVGEDPRKALAAWLTAKDNPLFARNFANRFWAQLMGRGVVEPVDDLRVSNPPTNGPLLDALAQTFVDSGFNLRAFLKVILESNTYQASAASNPTNVDDTRQFSRASLRRMRAEVLLDSLVKATDGERGFSYFPKGTSAVQQYPRSPGDTTRLTAGDSFLETFGRSARQSVCACDTKTESTLSQTLHLVAGDTVLNQIRAGKVAERLLAKKAGPEEVIGDLFLRALSRRPTPSELSKLGALVAESQGSPVVVYQDIFWSVLNSSEFLFNH
ncbi:MAG: Protein of unknown function (DUF1553)/Protein of unknown function (DUF1549) [Verrucomicrobia bacterium]|nr:MAG: Protein of unknown function (DUF1553)/Protein of unknown function (DUF1549) [Verrucomicrobiota bacterium]